MHGGRRTAKMGKPFRKKGNYSRIADRYKKPWRRDESPAERRRKQRDDDDDYHDRGNG